VRPVVIVGAYNYPRYYGFYDPWFQWGPWGPYGYARPDLLTASLRIEVTPRDAEVFVDGYSAGIVDDFDGVFQRLRLRPGGHEIAIYLDGYRTFRKNIYLQPDQNDRIRETLERLAPGEAADEPPSPQTADVPDDPPAPPMSRDPRQGGYGRRGGPAVVQAAPTSFGTLLVSVQPDDAEITVDGASWTNAIEDGRAQIRLAAGRHRVEIYKDGYERYVEDVLVRRGATLRLNVNLTREGDR
jgi:hypothetical protein